MYGQIVPTFTSYNYQSIDLNKIEANITSSNGKIQLQEDNYEY